jgi:16S rRNA (cytosine1402-N4)-methyltransferase
MLTAGGRLVAISFHSLEDRIVKRFIDAHHHPERQNALERRLPLRGDQLPRPTLEGVMRILPEDAEIALNPRSRSAVLRVAQRTVEPWPEPGR